jgi:transcriptional antiterminator RfaH
MCCDVIYPVKDPDQKALNQPEMKWYVIRTEPQADSLAAWELQRAGFEIYSPRVKAVRPKSERAEAPLFPGYLFLRWDLERQGKPSFQDAPHVLGWVSFGGITPPVPDEIIAELAQRVDALNSGGGLWRRFQTGEKVRVVSNAVEGLAEVTEEAKSPRSRVKVLMEFMGRLVPVQVPWESLRPIESGSNVKSRAPRRTRGRGRWIRGFEPQMAGSS